MTKREREQRKLGARNLGRDAYWAAADSPKAEKAATAMAEELGGEYLRGFRAAKAEDEAPDPVLPPPEPGQLYRPYSCLDVLWVVMDVDLTQTFPIGARRCDANDQTHIGRWSFELFAQCMEQVEVMGKQRRDARSGLRVGRKVGRTIYDGDTLIGVMDTPELAAMVVDAVNATADDARRLRQTLKDIKSLPSYHDCLARVCTELGVAGSPTFNEAIAQVKKRLGRL